MGLEILHRDETLVVGRDGRLMVANWWNAPTLAQMQTLARLADRMDRGVGGRSAYAQFVLEGTPIFTPEVKRVADALTRDHFGVGIAHVIELTGLKGSTTRAFLAGLLLIGRGTKPMKVFEAPETGAAWLAAHLGEVEAGWSAERVLAARLAGIDAHGV